MIKLITLILCHLLGDYVLQIDYIAKSKGTNLYHLFVHCALYCVPFTIVFGIDYRLGIVFVSHIVVDVLKARYKKINYTTDQILHYLMLMVYILS